MRVTPVLLPPFPAGEMFLSVTTSAVVELAPADLRSSTVAVFTFIAANLGGSLQLLLGPIRAAFTASGATHEHSFRSEYQHSAGSGEGVFTCTVRYEISGRFDLGLW